MKLTAVLRLFAACVICLTVGFIGSFFTTSENLSIWYAGLNKPFFNPPDWLFGPVWTTLYILMGISVFLVWQKGINTFTTRLAISWFVIQLILNGLWTPVFFGLHLLAIAFIEILLLWLAIVFTINSFRIISKFAALLLVPYLLWVTFASILNASLWLLNR
jgi:translocator protein